MHPVLDGNGWMSLEATNGLMDKWSISKPMYRIINIVNDVLNWFQRFAQNQDWNGNDDRKYRPSTQSQPTYMFHHRTAKCSWLWYLGDTSALSAWNLSTNRMNVFREKSGLKWTEPNWWRQAGWTNSGGFSGYWKTFGSSKYRPSTRCGTIPERDKYVHSRRHSRNTCGRGKHLRWRRHFKHMGIIWSYRTILGCLSFEIITISWNIDNTSSFCPCWPDVDVNFARFTA